MEKIIIDNRPELVKLEDGRICVHHDYSIDTTNQVYSRLDLCQEIVKSKDFVEFVKAYSTEQTVILYNTDSVKAIFDYPNNTNIQPDRARAFVNLLKTRVLRTFKQYTIEGDMLSQKDFIRFLKLMESYFSGDTAVQNIQLAENLQSVKKIDSVNSNTNKSVLMSVDLKGKDGVSVPKYITFQFPIYSADTTFQVKFEAEVFVHTDGDGGIKFELQCWRFEEIMDQATIDFVYRTILEPLKGIPAYFAK